MSVTVSDTIAVSGSMTLTVSDWHCSESVTDSLSVSDESSTDSVAVSDNDIRHTDSDTLRQNTRDRLTEHSHSDRQFRLVTFEVSVHFLTDTTVYRLTRMSAFGNIV